VVLFLTYEGPFRFQSSERPGPLPISQAEARKKECGKFDIGVNYWQSTLYYKVKGLLSHCSLRWGIAGSDDAGRRDDTSIRHTVSRSGGRLAGSDTMNTDKATQDLQVIRQLMERPIRFSSMSGLAAIQAGCWTFLGLVADRWVFNHAPTWSEALLWDLGVWGAVFLCALTGVLILTGRYERQQGIPHWSPVKKRILWILLPHFIAATGLILAIVGRYWMGEMNTDAWGYESVSSLVTENGEVMKHHSMVQFNLLPAICMLFYGLAVWQVGQFSPVEVKVLGAAFVLAGLLTAALWQWAPYWAMGITFGGFHLVYGVVVWIRHGG
jgi:hypothetical protein